MSYLSKLSLISECSSLKEEECDGYLNSYEQSINLSKRKSLSCIVWEVIAEQPIVEAILSEIKACNNDLLANLDYILWPNAQIEPPKLLVFDMDSTFIQIEVIDELAKRHGVGDKVSAVTESAMRGELDFSESLISRVACLKGLDDSTIDDIASSLPLSEGVALLVEKCEQKETKVAIVSGGFTPFVSKLKESMAIYRVKANDLEVKNAMLTGRVLGQIVDAKAKATFVNQLMSELNLKPEQVMAIGDGANDLMMMNETGFNLAYRAKPAVQAQAKGRMNITHLNNLIQVFGWD